MNSVSRRPIIGRYSGNPPQPAGRILYIYLYRQASVDGEYIIYKSQHVFISAQVISVCSEYYVAYDIRIRSRNVCECKCAWL